MELIFKKICLSAVILFTAFSANAASPRAQTAWEWITQGATIIDVRTPGEFSSGHLDNALNLPLQSLPEQLTSLDKSKHYVLYCRSGNRSAQAFKIMDRTGFIHIYNGGGYRELETSKP